MVLLCCKHRSCSPPSLRSLSVRRGAPPSFDSWSAPAPQDCLESANPGRSGFSCCSSRGLGPVTSILQRDSTPDNFATSCADAWSAYFQQLSTLDACLHEYVDPPRARRILHVVQNIDNRTCPVSRGANAGIHENPDAAAGVANTTEISLGPGTFLPAEPEVDPCSSENETKHSDTAVFGLQAGSITESDRSEALVDVSAKFTLYEPTHFRKSLWVS